MRVAVITTLKHNVGDDFVREGILHLLSAVLGTVEVSSIHKHLPLTARPSWDWYYHRGIAGLLHRLPRALDLWLSKQIDRLPLNPRTDKVLRADAVIQCGAPVYWLHDGNSCATAEWFEPLVRRRWLRVADHVKLLNLAGGTCQRFDSDGSEFAGQTATLNHIQQFFDWCRLTTVRDQLSLKVLAHVHRTAPLLPCTSIFARDRLAVTPGPTEYVALNYMPGAGHYAFGQPIDPLRWEQTWADFARQIALRRKCAVICHNKVELSAAERLAPSIPRLFSTDPREVLRFYSRASHGILNRVHGAFALASFGRPSLVIGTDSRARMTDQIGLRSVFVSNVSVPLLLEADEELGRRTDYKETFVHLAARARSEYERLLGEALLR